jgi:hypothetical protein
MLAASISAVAAPVATSDSSYQALGAVFPDPLGGCQNAAGLPGCDPAARGNVAARSFIGFAEFVNAIRFMNQKPDWQRYMEVLPLDGKLGPGAGNARHPDVPGNNLAPEWDPKPEYESAGLPRPDLSRLKSDVIVVRVTDEAVPDTFKKRYALSLSIHGIERAGAEGGIRAMEDLVTAATTDRLDAPVVPKEVKAGAPSFRATLQNSIIYFTFPNPDGWRRGSMSIDDNAEGGVFFQRYNGNGVDVNRDWPDIGFGYRYYSGLSEPESRALSNFFSEVRRNGGPFHAGDDLHGQAEDDALSFTLMPHGRHDYAKDLRIREASKRINRAQYHATKWSPIIQENDQPRGGGPGCAPGAIGPTCAKIYAQTWGSVYDTINYTTTGALGDWFDSMVGLQADGIDNEMSFSHLDKNTIFEPQTEQLHVAGNKAIIYSHVTELLDPPMGTFDAPGTKAYVPNARLKRAEQDLQGGPPPGTSPQAPIGPEFTPDGVFPFIVERDGDTYSGGMRVEATQPNIQGITPGGSAAVTLSVECRGCDVHRENPDADPEDEWIVVAEDYNQSFVYQQSGLTATVNNPQPFNGSGRPVEWRAVVSGTGGPANIKVTFTQGPASTAGNTGGDVAPKLLAYDVANTDFLSDLNKHIPAESQRFQTLDPAKVISGEQSLGSFNNVVLADDPLPGFTGLWGPVGPPPADFDIAGDPTLPGAFGFAAETRPPGTYTLREFEIASDRAAGGIDIRIDWEMAENDFDMYLYRVLGDKEILVGSSTGTQLETNWEQITLDTPLRTGKYHLYVDNFAAGDPRWTGKVKFKPVDPNPPTGAFTNEQRDAWLAKLREYVQGGGNLVLTDGALRALPGLTGMPTGAVGQSTVYAGQLSFEKAPGETTLQDPLLNAPQTISQLGARFNSGTRRQMYEPTPVGFAIQSQDRTGGDQSNAVQWDVDRSAFEAVPNSRLVATSADPGTRDAAPVHDLVGMGEVKLGKGQVRFTGALLPQPTEKFDHELGLEPYAVTYTGYIIFRNLLATAEEQARGTVAGVTYASRRKPRFLISRRMVRMTLKGTVPVRVSCRAVGRCRGTLLLSRGKRVLGKKRFNIRSKRRAVIKVRLRPTARRSLRRRPRTRIRAEAAVAYADGRRETVGPVRFRVSRPKG